MNDEAVKKMRREDAERAEREHMADVAEKFAKSAGRLLAEMSTQEIKRLRKLHGQIEFSDKRAAAMKNHLMSCMRRHAIRLKGMN
jgi:hypothetical protein